MEAQLLREITKAKDFADLQNVLWRMNLKKSDAGDLKNVKGISIALFVNSCWGFGDIIFGLKMYKHILEWYNIKCTVFTTKPKHFINNGINFNDVFLIRLPTTKPGDANCPNLKYTKIYSVNSASIVGKQISLKPFKFDLIFVAPWIGTDFKPNKSVMKNFFPYANNFNTFLFSEYNATNPELYDFPTGIGKKYQGVLVTKKSNIKVFPRLSVLKNPYIMAYVADTNLNSCINNFIKLMLKKYHNKYRNLDIVIPSYILNNESLIRSIIKHIKTKGYYENVVIIKKASDRYLLDQDNTFAFRADITPLPYKEFVGLLNYALPDVLGTGDQTISDLVSCCKNFNIYYQTMDWKVNFAKNLSKALKLSYLSKKSTSCGLEKMKVTLNTDLNIIAEKHNFAIEGKKKMDAVIRGAIELQDTGMIQDFVEIVLSSRQKRTVKSKFIKMYL